MIAKLFPTISNVKPTEAKVSTPLFELHYFDTPYTVKSHGPVANWYAFGTFSDSPDFAAGDIKWLSNVPKVRLDSGASYPPELSPEVLTSKQFGVKYSGSFLAESTTATFSLMGDGWGRLNINGTDTGTIELGLTRADVSTISVTGLVAAATYSLAISYWNRGKVQAARNVFAVTWNDSTTSKKIPLSAGNYLSPTDAISGITTYKLSNIIQTNLDVQKGSTNKLSFEIPLVSTINATIGYRYVKDGDYFEDVKDTTNQIKKFRMVEYHTGFRYTDLTTSTITKFVGQIRGWSINRTVSKSTARIEVYDWSSFLLDKVNTGFPNVSDYLIADLLGDSDLGGVAGGTKPRTYDGWRAIDAIDSLFYNADVDPKTLIQSREVLTVDDIVTTGRHLVDDRGFDLKLRLDKQFNYGITISTGDDSDDPYIWQFSIGDSLTDNIENIMDNYGLSWGFNNRGFLYADSVKNPVDIKSTTDMTFTGSWSSVVNTDALFATSNDTAILGDTVVATYIGTYSKLVLNVDPTFGTIDVRLSNPTLGNVVTASVSLNHPREWQFYKGTDDNVGNNPCLLQIGTDLKYGSYSLNITNTQNTNVSINALMVFEKGYEQPVETFYTADTATKNAVVINSLGIQQNISDLRNDTIVVGQLKGITSALSSPEGDSIVNPNNPVAQHIVSRAIDRKSIGSISANNYVGRQLQMMIVEPKIATEARADWLAIETIKRFNDTKKLIQPQTFILGNPLLELGDQVKIVDVNLQTLGTVHQYWINGFTETHDSRGRYTTRLDLESFEPWESFFRYPIASLKNFNNEVFTNKEYFNLGLGLNPGSGALTFTGTFNDPAATIQAQYWQGNIGFNHGNVNSEPITPTQFTQSVPVKGYLQIGNEIMKYGKVILATVQISTSVFVPRLFFGDLTRGMFATSTISNANLQSEWLHRVMAAQLSPYVSEEFGINPAVQFDLLVPGFVRVAVVGGGQLVDVLTGVEEAEEGKGWVFLTPGRYFYTWGMLDRAGLWNKANAGQFSRGTDLFTSATMWPGALTGDLGDWSDQFGAFTELYKVDQPGFYVHNKKSISPQQGRFVFDVKYRDTTGEFVVEEQRMKGHQEHPIFTAKRSSQGGEDSLNILSVFADPGDFKIQWYSNTRKRDIIASGGAYFGTEHDNYRRRYNGTENNGKGIRINVTNRFNVSRLAKLKLTRTILTFVQFRYKQNRATPSGVKSSEHSEVYLIDTIEDIVFDSPHDFRIDLQNGKDIFLPPYEGQFITTALDSKIHLWLNERDLTVSNFIGHRLGDPEQTLWLRNVAVSHLHLIEVEAFDFAGIRSYSKLPLWYLPDSFDFNRADWSSGAAKNHYVSDQTYPHEAIVFWEGEDKSLSLRAHFNLNRIVPYHPALKPYTPVLFRARIDESRSNWLALYGIYGVTIMGANT